ncbi:palmitoyltransferase [Theileria orientalis]|uniref:Palmitoyltransferase n=1 Tax=Theileria orientalis TaxID=68886 RepID=A0A976MBA6_THEOR|nr:palmitoyltransferase [Theileria orientalis]
MGRYFVFRDVIHDRNTSNFHRRTGFSLPLHVYQFLVLAIAFAVSFLHYYIILPIFVCNNAVLYTLSSILLGFVLIFYLIVSLIDPVDPNASTVVYNDKGPKKWPFKVSKILNKTENANISRPSSMTSDNPSMCDLEIHNPRLSYHDREQNAPFPSKMSHCNVCNFVDPSSKHCNVCNKCVINFDHHCIWVNNCIGASNYTHFILLLVSALVYLTFNIVLTMYTAFSYKDSEKALDKFRNAVFDLSLKKFRITVHLIWIFDMFPFVSLLYLFIFHVYLMIKKQTTYQYYIKRLEQLDDGTTNSEKRASLGGRFFDFIILNRRKKNRKSKDDEGQNAGDDSEKSDNKVVEMKPTNEV